MKTKEVEFHSILKPYLEQFIRLRKASAEWSDAYPGNLRRFDEYCVQNGLNTWDDYQTILNKWTAKKDSESSNSCRSRQDLILSFTKYVNKCRGTAYHSTFRPSRSKKHRTPHHFSEDELTAFFKQCDQIELTRNSLDQKLRKINVPVYFRLLYSTGLRVNEARWLKREDVDLETGRIYIKKSKGQDQHIVVMADSMLVVMKQLDKTAEKLLPNREFFFQSPYNSSYSESWVRNNFQSLWHKVSTEPAVPYDFRHQYATDNINSWIGSGFIALDKLTYLSKSMGHSSIESTKYYYSLVPALGDCIKTASESNFKNLLTDHTPKDSYEELLTKEMK